MSGPALEGTATNDAVRPSCTSSSLYVRVWPMPRQSRCTEKPSNPISTRVSVKDRPPVTARASAGVSSRRPRTTGLTTSTSLPQGTPCWMCRDPVRFVTTAGVRSDARAAAADAVDPAAANVMKRIHGFMVVISFTSAHAHETNVLERAVLLAERGIDPHRVSDRRRAGEEEGLRAGCAVDARRGDAREAHRRGDV